MLDTLYIWADLIWIPIVFILVHKEHKLLSVGFVVCSIIITHLITETIAHIGYIDGFIKIWSLNVYYRGFVISSFFYVLFIIMAHYSTETKGVIFMAASLTFFFAIFVMVSLGMLL